MESHISRWYTTMRQAPNSLPLADIKVTFIETVAVSLNQVNGSGLIIWDRIYEIWSRPDCIFGPASLAAVRRWDELTAGSREFGTPLTTGPASEVAEPPPDQVELRTEGAR